MGDSCPRGRKQSDRTKAKATEHAHTHGACERRKPEGAPSSKKGTLNQETSTASIVPRFVIVRKCKSQGFCGPKVLVAQSCLTLCEPMDRSPPGSSVQELLQAGIPEWVAVPFSRRSSRPRDLRPEMPPFEADI